MVYYNKADKAIAAYLKRSRAFGFHNVNDRRIIAALKVIRKTPVNELIKYEKVKKIKTKDRDDIYVYRVDLRHRIVFRIDQEADNVFIESWG